MNVRVHLQRTVRPVQETGERLYTYTPLWYSVGARIVGRGKGHGQICGGDVGRQLRTLMRAMWINHLV